MSDPRKDFELQVDGRTYLLRYTNTALSLAEKYTGKSVMVLAFTLAAGQVTFTEMIGLTCAGLEGARRKLRMGGSQWTPDSTADLLEDADDFDTVADPVTQAFNAAMTRWFPVKEEPEDPPTAAGTGTDSSEPPASQG